MLGFLFVLVLLFGFAFVFFLILKDLVVSVTLLKPYVRVFE